MIDILNVKEEPDNLSHSSGKEIEIGQGEIRRSTSTGENSRKCSLDETCGENSKKTRSGRESAKMDNFTTGTTTLRKKIIECDRAIRQIMSDKSNSGGDTNININTNTNTNTTTNNMNTMNIYRTDNINDILCQQQNTQPLQQRRHLDELEQRWVQQNAKMQKVLDTIDSLSPLECVYLFEPTTYRVPNIYDINNNINNESSENEQIVYESNEEIIEDDIESLLNL